MQNFRASFSEAQRLLRFIFYPASPSSPFFLKTKLHSRQWSRYYAQMIKNCFAAPMSGVEGRSACDECLISAHLPWCVPQEEDRKQSDQLSNPLGISIVSGAIFLKEFQDIFAGGNHTWCCFDKQPLARAVGQRRFSVRKHQFVIIELYCRFWRKLS